MPDDALFPPAAPRSQPAAGIGHNQPPAESAAEFDPELLRARLAADYDALATRFADLELGAAQVPKSVDSEAAAKKIVDWVAQQIRPATADAKTAHTREKSPYLAGGKIIDDFFLRRIDRLNLAIGPVLKRAEDYFARKKAEQRRQEALARQTALDRQRAAAAEAHRLAEEAQKKAAAGDRPTAAQLSAAAQEAEARAEEARLDSIDPPAPVKVLGEYGATGFAKTEWEFEVEDPSLIPLGYLMPDEKTIRAAIKNGVRDIPGLRIFAHDKFIVRRC